MSAPATTPPSTVRATSPKSPRTSWRSTRSCRSVPASLGSSAPTPGSIPTRKATRSSPQLWWLSFATRAGPPRAWASIPIIVLDAIHSLREGRLDLPVALLADDPVHRREPPGPVRLGGLSNLGVGEPRQLVRRLGKRADH